MADDPKLKIVLQKWYVAQNWQNCVLILTIITIFSESNPKQYLRVLRDKNELACSRMPND